MPFVMRTAVFVLCLLAVPARAQQPPLVAPLDQVDPGPPSKTLERAIKLYDKKDFYSASIELGKVIAGDTGDTANSIQRAEFFLVKTYYQLGFHGAAWAKLAAILQHGSAHTYYAALSKWAVALVRAAPSPSTRHTLLAYRGSNVVDDPYVANIRDELAYVLGRELAARDDVPVHEAADMFARIAPHSPFAARGQLELARRQLRDKDLPGGIARAMTAARSPELATESARLIASWAHLHGAAEQARTPLAQLAPGSAYARYQHARVVLDGKHPAFARVTLEAFDAVMVPSACRGLWPEDMRPLARRVIEEARPAVAQLLGLEDNAELFDRVMQLRRAPATPASDVVLAMLADPVMQERFAWIDELAKELLAVQRADRAWQTTMIAAEVLQELTLIQAIEQAEAGGHARQRLQLLARDLDVLARALESAPALPAGPDVEPGAGLAIASELCRATDTGGPRIANGTRPTSGCAGCATGDASGVLLVLAVLAFVRTRRRRGSTSPRA